MLVTQRDEGRQFELALESDGQGFRLELADFETGRFGPSILDLHLQLRYEGFQGPPRRVIAPSRGLPVELGSLPLYATRSGAVSIDLRGDGPR